MNVELRNARLQSEYERSEFSPAGEIDDGFTIADSENLLRAVIAPQHLSPNGSLNHEFITRTDLLERGLSVTRQLYGDVQSLGVTQASRGQGRSFFGVASIQTSTVRNIMHESVRALVVVEDAKLDNPGHGVILCAENYSPSKLKEIRSELIGKFVVTQNLES